MTCENCEHQDFVVLVDEVNVTRRTVGRVLARYTQSNDLVVEVRENDRLHVEEWEERTYRRLTHAECLVEEIGLRLFLTERARRATEQLARTRKFRSDCPECVEEGMTGTKVERHTCEAS